MQIFYAGRVQGVGFRYTVRAVANGFEVTGMVRNLPDGRVELAAEGAGDELEAFFNDALLFQEKAVRPNGGLWLPHAAARKPDQGGRRGRARF